MSTEHQTPLSWLERGYTDLDWCLALWDAGLIQSFPKHGTSGQLSPPARLAWSSHLMREYESGFPVAKTGRPSNRLGDCYNTLPPDAPKDRPAKEDPGG